MAEVEVDYSGWETRPRFDESPLRSVQIDKYAGVTLSTRSEGS